MKNDARALWLFAAVILVAAYGWIDAPYRRSIAAESAASQALAQTVARNDAAIDRAKILRRLEHRAIRDLRRFRSDPQPALMTAALLRELVELTRPLGLHAVSIDWEAPPGPKSETYGLAQFPLKLKVEGSFPGIVRFLERFTQRSILAGVENTGISQTRKGAKTTLSASIHASVYRVSPDEVDAR